MNLDGKLKSNNHILLHVLIDVGIVVVFMSKMFYHLLYSFQLD